MSWWTRKCDRLHWHDAAAFSVGDVFFQWNILHFFKLACTQFHQWILGLPLRVFPTGWLLKIPLVFYLYPFYSHANLFILIIDTKFRSPNMFYNSLLYFPPHVIYFCCSKIPIAVLCYFLIGSSDFSI